MAIVQTKPGDKLLALRPPYPSFILHPLHMLQKIIPGFQTILLDNDKDLEELWVLENGWHHQRSSNRPMQWFGSTDIQSPSHPKLILHQRVISDGKRGGGLMPSRGLQKDPPPRGNKAKWGVHFYICNPSCDGVRVFFDMDGDFFANGLGTSDMTRWSSRLSAYHPFWSAKHICWTFDFVVLENWPLNSIS